MTFRSVIYPTATSFSSISHHWTGWSQNKWNVVRAFYSCEKTFYLFDLTREARTFLSKMSHDFPLAPDMPTRCFRCAKHVSRRHGGAHFAVRRRSTRWSLRGNNATARSYAFVGTSRQQIIDVPRRRSTRWQQREATRAERSDRRGGKEDAEEIHGANGRE